MAVKIFSCFVEGLEARQIEVEVDILQGLPGLSIVGLGDTAVQEAKERIRSAIKNSGAAYPQQKKIINLAPAHIRKNGPCFDLPMALGLLEASGQITVPERSIIVGELALDGQVRPINGALSIAIFAQKHGMKLFLPAENVAETSLINYAEIFPVIRLSEMIGHCRGTLEIKPAAAGALLPPASPKPDVPEIDMNIIRGQNVPKRALQIAAAGGHHLLLYGPPGTGKTLLARALQGVLPPLDTNEMLEVMQIYSAAGSLRNPEELLHQRPFRRIHQSCSLPALIGGGTHARPGEISLAHHGVLFFDEIAEAPRHLLESLRQPLEERRIRVTRFRHHVEYPANFTLVAAMNPCPCGYYASEEKKCTCTNSAIVQYHKKLSGPIMDRFDLFVKLQREPVKLQSPSDEESSAEFKKIITKARQKQSRRFDGAAVSLNSLMNPAHIKEFCIMDAKTESLITRYCNNARVSARSFHNILKVARTIADLNGNETIQQEDATEAFTYRLQPTSPLV